MSETITIYGASDDLIEIEGAFREEFSQYDPDENDEYTLAVSDGTLLGVYYDDEGIWRFPIIKKGMGSDVDKEEHDVSEENSYSDTVTITAEKIDWVVFGSRKAINKRK